MRTTEDILRDIELNRIGAAHASGARRLGYSQELRELKRELNEPRLIELRLIGGRAYVRFSSWQKIFRAVVVVKTDTVVELHRVTQQSYGAREVGGSTDKFTSISKNHPDYDIWCAVARQLVATSKISN